MIASLLLVLALLFWGMMLIGIDKAQRHNDDWMRSGAGQKTQPEATSGGATGTEALPPCVACPNGMVYG